MVGEWRGVVVVVPGMHVQCARVLRGEDERVVRAAHAGAPRLHAARREPLAERTARHRDQAWDTRYHTRYHWYKLNNNYKAF